MTGIKVNPRNHLQVCTEKNVNFSNCSYMYTYVVPTPFNNFNPGLIQADKLQTECYLIEQ